MVGGGPVSRLLLRALERLCGRADVATVVSSLLFAAHHLSLTAALPLAALGATWSYLYLASGNLLVPVAIHAAWNARVFAGTVLGLRGRNGRVLQLKTGVECSAVKRHKIALCSGTASTPSSLAGWGGGGGRRQASAGGAAAAARRRRRRPAAAFGEATSPGAGAHYPRPRASCRRRCSVATFRRRRPPPPAGPPAPAPPRTAGASAQDGSAAGFLLENGLKLRLGGGGSGEPYRALVAESST